MRKLALVLLLVPALARAQPCIQVRDAAGNLVCDLAAVAACPAMGLEALESRIRGTSALGLRAKIRLKTAADALIASAATLRDTDQGRADLRLRFGELIVRVDRDLREGGDAGLADDIRCATESLWQALLQPG